MNFIENNTPQQNNMQDVETPQPITPMFLQNLNFQPLNEGEQKEQQTEEPFMTNTIIKETEQPQIQQQEETEQQQIQQQEIWQQVQQIQQMQQMQWQQLALKQLLENNNNNNNNQQWQQQPIQHANNKQTNIMDIAPTTPPMNNTNNNEPISLNQQMENNSQQQQKMEESMMANCMNDQDNMMMKQPYIENMYQPFENENELMAHTIIDTATTQLPMMNGYGGSDFYTNIMQTPESFRQSFINLSQQHQQQNMKMFNDNNTTPVDDMEQQQQQQQEETQELKKDDQLQQEKMTLQASGLNLPAPPNNLNLVGGNTGMQGAASMMDDSFFSMVQTPLGLTDPEYTLTSMSGRANGNGNKRKNRKIQMNAGRKRKRNEMSGQRNMVNEDKSSNVLVKQQMRSKMNKAASSKFAPWMLHAVNGEMEHKLSPIEVGVQVYIRGEAYTNWVPKRLYTSHKYHMKFNIHNLPDEFHDHLLQASVRLIHGTSKRPFETGAAIKATNDTKMNPSLFVKSGIFEGEMRFQLLLSSYKMPKGDKHFQFQVDFMDVVTNTTLFSIRSPEFEVFARKNDAEPLPDYALEPLRLSNCTASQDTATMDTFTHAMSDDDLKNAASVANDDDDDDSIMSNDENEMDDPSDSSSSSDDVANSPVNSNNHANTNMTKIEPASPFHTSGSLHQRTPLKKRKMAFGAAIQLMQSVMKQMDPPDRERAELRIKEELLHQ